MPDTDLIKWKEKFNTDVEEIDLQHKYFVQLINRLVNELSSTEDKVYQSMLLEEIIRYAVFHFTSEENIMFSHKYPDILQHKEMHNWLLEELNQKINHFKLHKITSQSITNYLTEWFVQHTINVDKLFGIYVTTERQNKM